MAGIQVKLPAFFGILPKGPLAVRRVEAFREQPGAAAHYLRGTQDGARAGVFYVHLADMRAVSIYHLENLAYHEGLPGHHLQIAIQQELDDIPRFRTHHGYTAFSEGFYLYAVALQLSSVDPGLMTKLQPKVGAKLTKHDRRYAAAFDYISKRIRVVEVCWGVSAGSGSRAIDRIPFVMPEVDEVSEDRKSQLLKQFELGPTKQAEFVKQLRFVSFEPVLTVALCSSVLECAT